MRKILIFILLVFGAILVNADNHFKIRAKDSHVMEINLKQAFTNTVSIKPFNTKQIINGLSITGNVRKLNDNYLIRVLLKDTEKHEHLVFESYNLINSQTDFILDKYCEETAMLYNVVPDELKIIVQNASLTINSIVCSFPSDVKLKDCDGHMQFKKEKANLRKQQIRDIVYQINVNNERENRLWVAGVTESSLLPWEEKKHVLGMKNDCIYTWGIEYYVDGIIDIGFERNNTQTKARRNMLTLSPYVSVFDWRNRHGRNWNTPIRDQIIDGTCWAFAAVGTVEALVNLYYNDNINMDLSEQEIVSCTSNDIGTTSGGYAGLALGWIANNGVSDEAAFPYSHSDEDCSNKDTAQETVFIQDAIPVADYTINNNDSVKKYLINKGPMASGINYWENNMPDGGHEMVLVGYNTIQNGDSIGLYSKDYIRNKYEVHLGDGYAGETYWIFKNSLLGNIFNYHNGYTYVRFLDNDCFRQPYYIETPIQTMNYSNSDILCVDNDGDGYYYWGIGPKPSSCPSTIPNEPDGDDNNSIYGPLDAFGNLTFNQLNPPNPEITPADVTISNATTFSTNQTLNYSIEITSGGTLTITSTVTLSDNVFIRVGQNGTLVVDGGIINNAKIVAICGGNINIIKNGKINNASGNSLDVHEGATMNFQYGEIN